MSCCSNMSFSLKPSAHKQVGPLSLNFKRDFLGDDCELFDELFIFNFSVIVPSSSLVLGSALAENPNTDNAIMTKTFFIKLPINHHKRFEATQLSHWLLH